MKLLNNLLIIALFAGFTGCGNAQPADNESDNTQTAVENQDVNPVQTQEALVKITTDFGTMTVKLYNETPQHRDNFLKLVKQGFYDSLLFHRIIKEFMIQGGDPDSKNAAPEVILGQGGPGYTVPAEIRTDLIHKKGALAAARLGDAQNPTKASSGSQFYLVQGKVYSMEDLNYFEQRFGIVFSQKQKERYTTVGGTPHLDGGYTVFGEVIEGLSVIDAIAAVKTGNGDRPMKDVRMKMELIKDYQPQE